MLKKANSFLSYCYSFQQQLCNKILMLVICGVKLVFKHIFLCLVILSCCSYLQVQSQKTCINFCEKCEKVFKITKVTESVYYIHCILTFIKCPELLFNSVFLSRLYRPYKLTCRNMQRRTVNWSLKRSGEGPARQSK